MGGDHDRPLRLQTAAGSSRIASCWYASTSFTVDVNMTDGQPHALELYFLDWDNGGRSESVTLSDAATGTVLATETVSSFHSGVYLDWSVSGNILITITKLSGSNAVLSGLFFDPVTVSDLALEKGTVATGGAAGTSGTDGTEVVGVLDVANSENLDLASSDNQALGDIPRVRPRHPRGQS